MQPDVENVVKDDQEIGTGRMVALPGKSMDDLKGITMSREDLKSASMRRKELLGCDELAALRKQANASCCKCNGMGHIGFDLSSRMFIRFRCVK